MDVVKSDNSSSESQSNSYCRAVAHGGEFTIAHLSDPHLTSLSRVSLRDLLSKRGYGYLSWRLHRHAEHRSDIIAALIEDLCSRKPDHVVLTGDLIHLSLPDEYREAQKLLQSLGSPDRVTVVPGNHDAYVPGAWERARSYWEAYMASDPEMPSLDVSPENPVSFPIVRVTGAIALIGLSTARPTLPFIASGSIGKAQLGNLEAILAETGRRKLIRIVLMHHPPLAGAVSRRKRLKDQASFHAILCREGAELILHGHTHHTSFGKLTTPWGTVAAIGVPSASALGRTIQRRARYHMFRFVDRPSGVELSLSVRVYSPEKGCFVSEGELPIALPERSRPSPDPGLKLSWYPPQEPE